VTAVEGDRVADVWESNGVEGGGSESWEDEVGEEIDVEDWQEELGGGRQSP
jgi:hypothetical protein